MISYPVKFRPRHIGRPGHSILLRCAFIAGLCLSAASSPAFSLGWSDTAAGRPLLEVFKPGERYGGCRFYVTVQDRDGVLYFGGDDVTSFDGETWRHCAVGNNLGVHGLAVDESGRIWVGGVGEIGYCERDSTGALRYVSLLSRLSREHREHLVVWDVEASPRGIVFSAGNKIMRWDGRAFAIWPLPEARSASSQKISDAVYIAHPETGLWKLDGDRPVLAVPFDPLLGRVPCFLHPLGGNAFLAVTPSALARLEGAAMTVLPGNCGNFIRENVVSAACAIGGHTLAVGTCRGGMALINERAEILRVIDRASGLPDQCVNGLFLDREKNLWITTQGGIVRMDTSTAVTVFEEVSHLPAGSTGAIASHNGRLHVIAGDGIRALKPGPASLSGAGFEPLPNPGLKRSHLALLSHARGLLNAGIGGIRLLQTDGALREIYQSPLDVEHLIGSRRHPGRIYFSDSKTVGWIAETGGRWEIHSNLAPLPEAATSLVEDASGNLWVGTFSKGVIRIAFDDRGAAAKSTAFEAGGGLPARSGRIRVGMLRDVVLVLTQTGVLEYNPVHETFRPVEALHSLSRVLALSNPNANGDVWLAGEAQLGEESLSPVVGKLTLDACHRAAWQPLRVCGLERTGATTALCFQEEAPGKRVLWIGGAESLLRVNLDEPEIRPVPVSPILSAAGTFSPAGRFALPLSVGATPVLPHARNRIEFQFAAPVYRDSRFVRYQSQLTGLDRDWTAPNAKSRREFTGLVEGKYTFSVRARRADGRWSAPVAYTFLILPPWYRTPWAYGLFALVTGAGFYGGCRFRVRQIRTYNRELEALVGRRTEELVHANAEKTEFITNMSHEIRNPLNGVVGLACLLQDSGLSTQQRSMTASLRKCAEHLSTLLEDVLDFSRIEAGRVTIAARPFDLRSMLADIRAIFAWQSQQQAMPLDLQVSPDIPNTVVGDEAKTKQIVINYVSNAFKYAGQGSIEIDAEIRRLPGGSAEIVISVGDHGPGIPIDEQPMLFDKFRRGRRARLEKIRGSGLGLAVCRAYAEKMGGAVGLSSEPGRGATFWFKVAMRVPEVAPATAASSEPLRQARAARALAVEDQDYNLLVIEHILTRFGYQTDHATDGPDALAKLQANTYDIVFMDWDLPGMNGVEVTRRLRRSEPRGRHTLVIATTAFSTTEKRRECMDAGMDGFAAKPLSPEKLRAMILELRKPCRRSFAIEGQEDSCAQLDCASAPWETGLPPLPAEPKPVHDGDAGAGYLPRRALDLSIFKYMADQKPGRMRQLVETFITALEKDATSLVRAVSSGDGEVTRRLAHHVLSQTALVSATEVAAVAATIQKAAIQGDMDIPRSVIGLFEAEVSLLKENLCSALETT